MTHSDSEAIAIDENGTVAMASGTTGVRGAPPRQGFRKGMCPFVGKFFKYPVESGFLGTKNVKNSNIYSRNLN